MFRKFASEDATYIYKLGKKKPPNRTHALVNAVISNIVLLCKLYALFGSPEY